MFYPFIHVLIIAQITLAANINERNKIWVIPGRVLAAGTGTGNLHSPLNQFQISDIYIRVFNSKAPGVFGIKENYLALVKPMVLSKQYII